MLGLLCVDVCSLFLSYSQFAAQVAQCQQCWAHLLLCVPISLWTLPAKVDIGPAFCELVCEFKFAALCSVRRCEPAQVI